MENFIAESSYLNGKTKKVGDSIDAFEKALNTTQEQLAHAIGLWPSEAHIIEHSGVDDEVFIYDDFYPPFRNRKI